MNKEQLFTGIPGETAPISDEKAGELYRTPFEGYILGEFPQDLREVSEGEMTYKELSRKQEPLLAGAASEVASNSDYETARLTQLDLLFMLGGYIPAGEEMYSKPPIVLLELIKDQSDRFDYLLPYMTYEMIIDVNAEEYRRTGNMRVYSDGEDGKHERDFYLGHSLAEPFAANAAEQLFTFADNPDPHHAANIFNDVRASLVEFKRFMGSFGRLPKESFAYFRQYLDTYPDGTRNASGAFMPSVQLLELAMSPPTDMQELFIDESMKYFPLDSQPLISSRLDASKKGVNIKDKYERGELTLDSSAHALLVEIVDEFINFRMAHMGVTKGKVPEAFSHLDQLTRDDIKALENEGQILDSDHQGTAGFDVRNVLINSVYRLVVLRAHLNENMLDDLDNANNVCIGEA